MHVITLYIASCSIIIASIFIGVFLIIYVIKLYMLLNYLFADSDNTVLCPKANYDHLAEPGELKRYDCNIVAVQDVEEACKIIFNE